MNRAKAITFVAIALLFVITASVAAQADTLNVNFVGVGGENQNGEYTYPYFLSINNGPQLAMVCDDYYHTTNFGDQWQANITSLTSGDLSNTRFNDLNLYEEASYLLMQMNDGNQAEWGNINFALWKIMSPSVDLGQAPPGTEGAQYWYDLARTTNLSNIDFSNVRILTPTDAHSQVGDQEFLFLTPEPGTLALIGSGILGLYTQRRRFV